MKTSLPKQLLILLTVFCFLAAMGPKYRQAVSAQDKTGEPPDNAAAPEQNGTFSNPAPISIPGIGIGSASGINVSGMSGTITKITVTLNGINHGNPDDLDILVEAPTGNRNLIVMSDAGGISDLTGTVLTLSDTTANLLPDLAFIGDGAQTYRPGNHEDANDPFIGFFGIPQSPAPQGSQTLASQFNGINPNGPWFLRVMDDANAGVGGSIANGWSITIETNPVVNATEDTVDGSGCTLAHCSLREAVNDSPPGGTITVAPALAGQVITLSGTQILINKSLTIDAGGLASRVSVSGNNFSRVFQIAAGAIVTMNNLTVANGRIVSTPSQSADGGGIQNSGTLTLDSCIIANNSAISDNTFTTTSSGGGIHNAGTLTLNNSVVRENQVIRNDNNSNTSGGGISSVSIQPIVINNTRIHNNQIIGGGSRNGGGIFKSGGGSILILNSSIDNNTVNGGIGGGLDNSTGDFILANVTIYNNSSFGGGGVSRTNNGSGLIVNSTISGNSATFNGGISGGNQVRLRNSIVAGNAAPNAPDGSGIVSLGNNLIGNTAGSTTVFQPTDIINPSSTGLGAFGDYGGARLTIPLMVGSPAINAGSNCVLTNDCADGVNLGFNLTTDQRGPGFPRRHGLTLVDIGAYETAVPTAAEVSIGGRVVNAEGRGISRAYITLMDASGAARMALTNPFGYFRFDGLPAGETYVLTVRNKRYRFEPQTVNAFDDVFDLQIVALPLGP